MQMNDVMFRARCGLIAIAVIGCLSLSQAAVAERNDGDAASASANQGLVWLDRLITAAGADKLETVTELRFTFHVERGGNPAAARAWTWNPATGEVTMHDQINNTRATYNRHTINEYDREADAMFINDTFWLLPQLHLAWSRSQLDVSIEENVTAPVVEQPATRVTVTYPAEGGYTPGDAYDLFVGENDQIIAWHFRRANAEAPSLTVSFESHETFGPLRIAKEHRNAEGNFRLHFTDVAVSATRRR